MKLPTTKKFARKKIARTIAAAALSGLLVAVVNASAWGATETALDSAGIAKRDAAAVRTTPPAILLAGNSKGGKHHRHGDADEGEGNFGGPFFRPVDAGYFHQCYGGTDVSSLPPGLQKHVARTGHLPPGLEKHLERNGQLPPGLQKRMSSASPCVLERMGPLPPNSRIYMLGRDAYLINYHTRAIIDILRGAY
jgi:hypothetical protein